jgi:hypothetical protein
MNKNNIGNYFELEYLSNMLYGYYTNKFNYPINIFFDTEELIRYDDYEPKLIGCSITNEEYLKLINKKTLIEKNLDV